MVGAKLKELDSDFDLVMVSELMDESLVLLAHLLCLPLHAMVGIKRNARKEEETVKQKHEQNTKLTAVKN